MSWLEIAFQNIITLTEEIEAYLIKGHTFCRPINYKKQNSLLFNNFKAEDYST